MIRTTILAAGLLALAGAAQAQNTIGGPVTGPANYSNQQSGTNANVSTGALGSGNTTTAGGGDANVVNNLGGGARGFRNTPSVALGLATAYCQNSGGAFGSGPGFSLGLAFGKHDADCKRFNQALILESMGRREEALLVLANNPEVHAAIIEADRQRKAVADAQPAKPRGAVVAAGSVGPSPADCRALRTAIRETRRRTDASAVAARDYFDAYCTEAGMGR